MLPKMLKGVVPKIDISQFHTIANQSSTIESQTTKNALSDTQNLLNTFTEQRRFLSNSMVYDLDSKGA